MFRALTLPLAADHLSLLRLPVADPAGGRRRTVAFAAPVAGERRAAASLYEVLQVEETATAVEIKTAYRSLAKRFHPDAAAADGRDFIVIHEAYATLSDPAARAQYDRSIGPFRRRTAGGFAPGMRPRRWETDQCW